MTHPGQKILVIEDQPDEAAALAAVLKPLGCPLQTVSQGEEALNLVSSEPPRLAFLDLGLADVDGLVLLEKLRRAAPDTGVVALSAAVGCDAALRALSLGALNYFGKPIEPHQLLAATRQILDFDALKEETRRLRLGSVLPRAAAPSLAELSRSAAAAAERLAIEDTLHRTRGNILRAAKYLRTDNKTLHVKLKKYGIRARDFGPGGRG